MWLKLTKRGYKQDVNKHLVNMNNIVKIESSDGGSNLYSFEQQVSSVVETIEEIELMLKGVESQKADPRSRDVIGMVPDNELSESDWNLRYNKP